MFNTMKRWKTLSSVLCALLVSSLVCDVRKTFGHEKGRAPEPLLREGLYVAEDEGTKERVLSLLTFLAEAEARGNTEASSEQSGSGEFQLGEEYTKAASLCRELYFQGSHFLIRVPIVLDVSKADKLGRMLPAGILQFQEDADVSSEGGSSAQPALAEVPRWSAPAPKVRRFLRDTGVVRYVGVRWLCLQLLQRHPQLREACFRLVESTVAKRVEEALEAGTDHALLDFVRRYGWTDVGRDLSFLLARRYMENGEITKASALFKLSAGQREADEFIAMCMVLRRKHAASRPRLRCVSADVNGQTELKVRFHDGFEAFCNRGTKEAWKVCGVSDVTYVGRELVGTVLVAENELVHYVVCLRAGEGDGKAESSSVEWAIPLCWQRLLPEDGLSVAESQAPETQRCIETLARALTPATVTGDGRVIVQTGHGIIAAVDLVFGFPVWLVCYALDIPPTERTEGKRAISPFIRRHHWPNSWASQPPACSDPASSTLESGAAPLGAGTPLESGSDLGGDGSVVVAAPQDSSKAFLLSAEDGLTVGVVESLRDSRFEFKWVISDGGGFIFLVGRSVLAIDCAGAVLRMETYALPEEAWGPGVACSGVLLVPTAKGLYEIDFTVERPRMRCLSEWRLSEGARVEVLLESDQWARVFVHSNGKTEEMRVRRR